jgi:hypothetical protein
MRRPRTLPFGSFRSFRSFLSLLSLAPAAALLVTACDGDDNPGGTYTPTLTTYGDDSDDAGSPPPDVYSVPEAAPQPEAAPAPPTVPPIAALPVTAPAICANGAAPSAYVLAQNGTLFSFDPTTLAMQALGVPACANDASAFAVSASGTAYVISDALYQVDLTTLACTRAPFPAAQVGVTAIAVGAGTSSDRLWSYAPTPAPSVGVSDLSTFVRFQTGAFAPAPWTGTVDLTMDAYGRLFALAIDGTLVQLDPATGAIVGQDMTGFDGTNGGVLVSGTMALMAYGGQLYFFSGPSGALSRYDVSTQQLQPLGLLDQAIVGASAPACVAASTPLDAGAEAGAEAGAPTAGEAGTSARVTPFTAGDAWIGTFTCQQGLTDLAIVVDAVSGNTIAARFDFEATGGGEGGSFVLTGTYDPDTREAAFTPGDWVSQPAASGMSTLSLDGFVDLSGRQLAGAVTQYGCGSFLVQR